MQQFCPAADLLPIPSNTIYPLNLPFQLPDRAGAYLAHGVTSLLAALPLCRFAALRSHSAVFAAPPTQTQV